MKKNVEWILHAGRAEIKKKRKSSENRGATILVWTGGNPSPKTTREEKDTVRRIAKL